ncbi:MAG: NAD(P)-dependent oxidoreductase [Gammaproteobacteria bacterium]|nr:NAD(P)-dependent oxidoreductase [Gammaproteobacteria bacterium]
MILVDKALEQRQQAGNPIRVAMVGAGFMARGIALQIETAVPGMTVVAISNRSVDGARRAYSEAGVNAVTEVASVAQLEQAIASGKRAVTDDPFLLCEAAQVDAIIEVTGTVEFAAAVVMRAIARGKHVIAMNAELDGTLGPILKTYADRAGVVFTNADGDQPGVIMNLYRFAKGIGVKPVLCGNIKGLHDPYRNPTTQEAFAKHWRQKPNMVTSFADGTKISFEQAIVANATGMRVAKRGMHGPTVPAGTPIREAVHWYPLDDLLGGPGVVDYVVGAEPGPGVFVLGTCDHPVQQHYLNLYKLGEGPLYCFYTPYHLCHFEVPNTVARAVLFHDAAIAPLGAPTVDVVAAAKIDLAAGAVLDGLGEYMTYGLAENSDVAREQQLLPIGLAVGCRLKRAVSRDTALTYADVEIPPGRLCDQLRREQDEYFAQATPHMPRKAAGA